MDHPKEIDLSSRNKRSQGSTSSATEHEEQYSRQREILAIPLCKSKSTVSRNELFSHSLSEYQMQNLYYSCLNIERLVLTKTENSHHKVRHITRHAQHVQHQDSTQSLQRETSNNRTIQFGSIPQVASCQKQLPQGPMSQYSPITNDARSQRFASFSTMRNTFQLIFKRVNATFIADKDE